MSLYHYQGGEAGGLLHLCAKVRGELVKKVTSACEPKWAIRPELIPISVALSD